MTLNLPKALASKQKASHKPRLADATNHYNCDSAGIQTQDLQNRNLTLYSAKLRSRHMRYGRKNHCKGTKK